MAATTKSVGSPNQPKQQSLCQIKIVDIDNKLIYSGTVKQLLTTSELKKSLHKHSYYNTKPSDQQILFNGIEISNNVTMKELYNQNDNKQVIQLCITSHIAPRYSV